MKTKPLVASALIVFCALCGNARGASLLDVGDILTANYLGNKVLRINPQTGVQQSLGSFTAPTDLSLAPNGDLYVGQLDGAIKRLTITNNAVSDVGPASLTSVRGLVLDPESGDLFVTGRSNTVDVVMRVNPSTRAGTLITQGGNLSMPTGIEILGASHLVVASWLNSRIVKVRVSDGFQTVLASGGVWLDRPWGLAVSGDLVYATHYDSKHINRISATTGTASLVAVAPGIPYGLGLDASGNVLVGAVGNTGQQDMLAKFSPQGASLGIINVGLRQQISGIEVSQIQISGNRPPVPASPAIEWPVSCGAKIRIQDLLGSDPDGDTLVLTSVDEISSEGGSVAQLEAWVAYAPPVGGLTAPSDTFGYTVSDGNGNIVAGVVTIWPMQDTSPSLNIAWEVNPGGTVRVTGSGIPQRVYSLEYTEDLALPEWLFLGSVTADDSGILEFLDTPPEGSPVRFYRTSTTCP